MCFEAKLAAHRTSAAADQAVCLGFACAQMGEERNVSPAITYQVFCAFILIKPNLISKNKQILPTLN